MTIIVNVILAAFFVGFMFMSHYVDKRSRLSVLHGELFTLYAKLRLNEITINDLERSSRSIFEEIEKLDSDVYKNSYDGFLRIKNKWEE